MSDELEVRHLDGLRAETTDPRAPKLVGYAIRTGVRSADLGGFVEIISPDAIRRALEAADDVLALRNHDSLHVLGRRSAKTLRVAQDDQGLKFEIDVPDAERGLVESVARGDLPGASFAFSHAVDRWDDRTSPPTRTILDMRLREISAGVPFPAYPGTHVAALRSLEQHRHQTTKEPPVSETATATVTDPIPTVSAEARDVEVVGEERILRPADSFRSYVERQGADPEFAKLGMGRFLRMVLGPRTDLERRALALGTDSAGGYTVPALTLARFYDRLRAATVVIQAGASTVPLETGKSSTILKLSADPTVAWRAENAAVAESDPTFAAVTLTPKSLAVMFKAARELLDDSINAEQMLELALVRAMAVEVDRVALFGSGSSNQPLGLSGTSGIGSQSMGTNGAAPTAAVGWTKVLDAVGDVEDANATPGALVAAPRTYRSLAKLQDTTNQFQAPPALLADRPRLATTSIPVTQTQGTSTDCSTLFVGQWEFLLLGVRQELRIEVLRELFAGNLQYGFLAHLRMDVAVAQPAAFSKLIGIRP